MADLSPHAQAVLEALYMEELNGPQQLMARAHAAAALRAGADQVVPEPAIVLMDGRTYEAWTAKVHNDIRTRLLSIANELEQCND